MYDVNEKNICKILAAITLHLDDVFVKHALPSAAYKAAYV